MNTFLKGFFWVAFASFLAASIPHVAYFFRAFEPQSDGHDMLWWGVSYAIAVSIDVTIFLLSVTVARLHRRGNAGGLIASVWLFILALCGLSWFINWEYAQQFSSTLFSRVTPIQLSVLSFTVGKIGDINPIIASAFQVLAIAYTWIADKIAADEKPKTADELKRDADEMEARTKELERISGLKRASRKGTLFGLIDDAKDIVSRMKQSADSDTQEDEVAIDTPHVTWNEQGKVDSVQFPGKELVFVHRSDQFTDNFQTNNGQFTDIDMEEETPESIQSEMPETRTRRALYITFEDAHMQTGYSIEYLKKLVRTGQLATRKDDDSRLLVSKLVAYLASHRKGTTGEIPAIKLATIAPTNGHHPES